MISLFNCAVPPPAIRLLSATRRHWIFTPSVARRFSASFKDSRLNADRRLVSLLWTDSLLLVFNSTCAVLDCVATLWPSSLIYWPYLQATTQAEWRLKVKLRVSFGLFRVYLLTRILKEDNSKYLSPIVANSSQHPRVLFSAIKSVVHALMSCPMFPPQPAKCFFVFFFSLPR